MMMMMTTKNEKLDAFQVLHLTAFKLPYVKFICLMYCTTIFVIQNYEVETHA